MAREYDVGEFFDNQYCVLRRHRGAMGIVDIARDRITEPTFAIKSPLPERSSDPALRGRFLRESEADRWRGSSPRTARRS